MAFYCGEGRWQRDSVLWHCFAEGQRSAATRVKRAAGGCALPGFAILKKKPQQLRYEQRYDPSDKVNHPLHSLRTSQGNISSDTCVVASLPVFDDPAGVLDPYVMHDVAVRANPS